MVLLASCLALLRYPPADLLYLPTLFATSLILKHLFHIRLWFFFCHISCTFFGNTPRHSLSHFAGHCIRWPILFPIQTKSNSQQSLLRNFFYTTDERRELTQRWTASLSYLQSTPLHTLYPSLSNAARKSFLPGLYSPRPGFWRPFRGTRAIRIRKNNLW